MWQTGVKALGNLVKALRMEAGLSQLQFAKKARIGRNTIANIETGRRNASIEQLIQLAVALEVEPSLLLDVFRFPNEISKLRTHYQGKVGGLTNDKLRVLAKFLTMKNENLNNTEQILDLLLMRDSFVDTGKKPFKR